MKKNKKLNIAIVGLGNIGLNLYRHLVKNRKSIIEKNNINFEVKYVSAKNKNKKRRINIPKKKWLKNYLLAARLTDVDVVVEVVVDVDVTTVPEADNWLAPNALIIVTSSTVAPLMNISSAAQDI